ncbi:hypothetical protein [Parasitella parasitica]|uniref:GATA-type domain-containing protein n=1 Tax=Parasitella parasitica TaxID=35722 RepID=A0A0B7MZ65_9FUNG|nr:hypothetical protein [Parasitella parasitica]
MTNSPSPPSSSFSYHTMESSDRAVHMKRSERLVLPPISSMNAGFTSKSWPPPPTLSPSALSTTSSNITMQEISSINISPIQHQPSNQEPWSPIPQANENSQRQTNRLDYFTSAPSSSNHTLPAIDQHQYPYRQNSLPQISALTRDAIQHTNRASNAPIEMVLTPASLSAPSIRTIERDIEQVVQHCNSLATNMTERKHSIVENDYSFTNPNNMRPWLDDMISKANEVLNALLRLRKHQLAAEYAKLHNIPNQHAQNSLDGQYQEAEGYSLLKNSSTNALSLSNAGRLRKRGKRPVFQGRCHSCNISETPEWRRGPDGARTLCNACGLHYAKLNKKKNGDKQSQEDVKKETSEHDRDDTSMK